jgi:predicted nucleotidyltransferase
VCSNETVSDETVSNETLLNRAATVARAAVETFPEVQAALVFGSVARSSADASSDIDILLATSDRVRVSDLVRRLSTHCGLASVALSAKSWSRLAHLRDNGSLFFRHLQLEGKILEDDSERLAELLAPPIVNVDVKAHRSTLARSLSLYNDVQRLGGFHLFALSHIYVLGKRAAQLCLQEAGRDIYDPERVFDEVANLHPEIASELGVIPQLRPLHAVARGTSPAGGGHTTEFSCDSAFVESARTTVERLLHR